MDWGFVQEVLMGFVLSLGFLVSVFLLRLGLALSGWYKKAWLWTGLLLVFIWILAPAGIEAGYYELESLTLGFLFAGAVSAVGYRLVRNRLPARLVEEMPLTRPARQSQDMSPPSSR